MADTITFDDFLNVDIRSGKIIKAESYPEARKPAYKLQIDFGPDIGIKKSSAQITENYTCEQLIGKNIMAVVNFPPRQIGKFMSEVLVLGFYDQNKNVELVTHSNNVKPGQQLM
uniref:tRNA-binding protein n=1 Tax=OCS116 cluster bacterium TaxID=2030921 RepID=A0A2A4YZS8_9PROT